MSKGCAIARDSESHNDFASHVTATRAGALDEILEKFVAIADILRGDLQAIERVATEMCLDLHKQGVVYAEIRYSPHLLADTETLPDNATTTPTSTTTTTANITKAKKETKTKTKTHTKKIDSAAPEDSGNADGSEETTRANTSHVSANDVVLAVTRGLRAGCKSAAANAVVPTTDADMAEEGCPAAPPLMVRQILCCLRPFPAWSADVVSLAIAHGASRGDNNDSHFDNGAGFSVGVVGIDLAASEACPAAPHASAFARAARAGVHRTVHAGEGGPGVNVTEAIEMLHAERIGHGYNVLHDAVAYARARRANVHFECCPTSSVMTQSVPGLANHPVIQFQEANVSSSISSDDPGLFNVTLGSEIQLMLAHGLSARAYAKSVCDAAKAAFLPPAERRQLVARIESAYAEYLV